MRQVSGAGSDDDRTDATLKKRENVARRRRSDDDTILPGLILLQRDLPARSGLRAADDNVAVVWALGRAGHETAMLMVMIVAVPRSSGGSERIRDGSRSTARLTGHTTIVMMMTTMSIASKNHAFAGGPQVGQAAQITGDARGQTLIMTPMMMMGVMLFKFLAIRGGPNLPRARGRVLGMMMVRMMASLSSTWADGLLAAQAPA